jgi:large subunit ribosomal protein L21
MTYAIIQTGGKQIWVEPGRFYDVELLHQEPETLIDLEEVLLINHEGAVTLGHPFIAGATVRGRVLSERRARKIIVYKMKPKKKTRKKNGHRQNLTRFLVESITWNGTTVEAPASASAFAPVISEVSVEDAVEEDEILTQIENDQKEE